MRLFRLRSRLCAQLLISIAITHCAFAQIGGSANTLEQYEKCNFADGLQIVRTDPLAQGITSRTVDTDNGTRQIDMLAGVRIMFAYPDTDFYANVKAEVLPAQNRAELKKSLLENLQHIAHGNTVNTSLKSPLHGFEVHGIDREKLEGGVLGVYLLFDDPESIVTTVYFLNQEPQSRKFQSMDEYRQLRDRFLAGYSACIRENQKRSR
jgi:hypothetical protein